jgi:hypothetical protein
MNTPALDRVQPVDVEVHEGEGGLNVVRVKAS